MTRTPASDFPEALVVFSGETEIRWLRVLLRAGFRHCFVLVCKNGRWICLDPLAHRLDLDLPDVPEGFDWSGWLGARGLRVVRTVVNQGMESSRFSLAPFSCVEAVKRVLGLRNWRIVTPWQLYRFLSRLP